LLWLLVDVFENEYSKKLVLLYSLTVVLLLTRDLVIPYESPNYFSYKGALYFYHVLFWE
jgi:hypothetical protein